MPEHSSRAIEGEIHPDPSLTADDLFTRWSGMDEARRGAREYDQILDEYERHLGRTHMKAAYRALMERLEAEIEGTVTFHDKEKLPLSDPHFSFADHYELRSEPANANVPLLRLARLRCTALERGEEVTPWRDDVPRADVEAHERLIQQIEQLQGSVQGLILEIFKTSEISTSTAQLEELQTRLQELVAQYRQPGMKQERSQLAYALLRVIRWAEGEYSRAVDNHKRLLTLVKNPGRLAGFADLEAIQDDIEHRDKVCLDVLRGAYKLFTDTPSSESTDGATKQES